MSNEKIQILLVDDIAETRESIKKLLAFESDFEVIGSANNGREGVNRAKELRPDIVIMDINMPDMDGLEAASLITKSVPKIGVIMMSVQSDQDYYRKAMRAGARDFLSKPVDMDELYGTIRRVYQEMEPMRQRIEQMGQFVPTQADTGSGDRAGHIIVVYSPQGGAGCTTIATNLASGLMKEGIKVLLVDADLQFGDVGVFLNIQAQSTLVDLAEDSEDLDIDVFENIVRTHDSGLKVLLGPPRPEEADTVRAKPNSVMQIVQAVANSYDFIVIDTASYLDEVLVSLLDIATKVVLVVNPTLTAVKNVRLVMDLFDRLEFDKNKTVLVVNKAGDERDRKGATISAERIQNYLRHPVQGLLPEVEDRVILSAINRGVPVIASERDTNKPLIKQLLQFSDLMYSTLMGADKKTEDEGDESKDKKNRLGFLGR